MKQPKRDSAAAIVRDLVDAGVAFRFYTKQCTVWGLSNADADELIKRARALMRRKKP